MYACSRESLLAFALGACLLFLLPLLPYTITQSLSPLATTRPDRGGMTPYLLPTSPPYPYHPPKFHRSLPIKTILQYISIYLKRAELLMHICPYFL